MLLLPFFGSHSAIRIGSDVAALDTARDALTCGAAEVVTGARCAALGGSDTDQWEGTLATRLGTAKRPAVVVQSLDSDDIVRLKCDLVVERGVVWVDSDDGLTCANVVRGVLVLDGGNGGAATVGAGLAAHGAVGSLFSRVASFGSSHSGTTSEGTNTCRTGELGVSGRSTKLGRLDHGFLALDPRTLDVALVGGSSTVDRVFLGVRLVTTLSQAEKSKESTEDGGTNAASNDDTGELLVAEDLVVGAKEVASVGTIGLGRAAAAAGCGSSSGTA